MHFFILFTLITSAFAIPLLDKETNVDVKLPIDGTVSVTHYGRYNPHGDAALREAKYILGTRENPHGDAALREAKYILGTRENPHGDAALREAKYILGTRENPHGDAALREAKYILGTREVVPIHALSHARNELGRRDNGNALAAAKFELGRPEVRL